jgi:predicted acyl esterase
MSTSIVQTTREQMDAQFPDLITAKLPSPEEHPRYGYPGFQPGIIVLKKGHVKGPGLRPFNIDTIFDRDVGFTLRDGVTIYTDVFRPSDSDAIKVPAILPWSPYGKTGNGTFFVFGISSLRQEPLEAKPLWRTIELRYHGSTPLWHSSG